MGAAEIGPDLLLLGVRQEGGKMILGNHGDGHQPLLPEAVVAEGIDDAAILQIGSNEITGGSIVLHVFQRRLVGDVEIGVLQNAEIFQLLHQCGEEFSQKAAEIVGKGRSIPAKAAHRTIRGLEIDLRGILGAPLGEEGGDLKIADAAFLGKGYPFFQIGKIKVQSLRAFRDGNQLTGHPAAVWLNVQRRGDDRGQQRVDAVGGGLCQIVFEDLPKPGREHLAAVDLAQAVAMEPFGVADGLGRQSAGGNGKGDGNAALKRPLAAVGADGNGCGWGAMGDGDIQPEDLGEGTAVAHRLTGIGDQRIGDQSGGSGQIGAGGCWSARVGAGDGLYPEKFHGASGAVRADTGVQVFGIAAVGGAGNLNG